MFNPEPRLRKPRTQTILPINNMFQVGCAKCQWLMLGQRGVICCDWFWLLPFWYSLKSTTISKSSTSSNVSSRPSASCFPLPNSLQWCKKISEQCYLKYHMIQASQALTLLFVVIIIVIIIYLKIYLLSKNIWQETLLQASHFKFSVFLKARLIWSTLKPRGTTMWLTALLAVL